MRNKILICSLFIGCTTPEPNCGLNRDSQTGLYSMSLLEESGDCGEIDDFEVEIGNGIPFLGSGCIVNQSEWSQYACNTYTRIDCDDLSDGSIVLIWNVHSIESNSENLAGTLSMAADKKDGTLPCESHYSFKAHMIK